MFKVIDTHTHFDAEEFDEDRAEAFGRAKEAGVSKVFLPAIDVKTTHAVLALAKEYPGYAYPMIGLHPEEVKEDWKEQLAELRKILEEHRTTGNASQAGSPQFSDLIAIGEVGLDYYWSREFENEQLEAFEEQVKWSVETQLPLMIHCRKAQNEMVHLLRKYEKELPGGVFHCFTGNQKEAEELLSFDTFVLGVGGVSTFKSSHLREDLPAVVPMDRIVLETDSPYMA
ncbi:MAG: TatD family hydrolase, partial [Prevotella sp.]|nr:TatD family hydrolase [Prevotella sp.]